jgi:hypothetical protein
MRVQIVKYRGGFEAECIGQKFWGYWFEIGAHQLDTFTGGNVTRQLHLHVVGRRPDDGLWPDPVWGRGSAVPPATAALAQALALVRAG